MEGEEKVDISKKFKVKEVDSGMLVEAEKVFALQDESGSAESVQCNVSSVIESSSKSLPPGTCSLTPDDVPPSINPAPDVTLSDILHEPGNQSLLSEPKPDTLSHYSEVDNRSFLGSPEMSLSLESKPELKPNPLDSTPNSDRQDPVKSKQNPNSSTSKDCSLVSKQHSLSPVDPNLHPSVASANSAFMPNPAQILDPIDPGLPQKSLADPDISSPVCSLASKHVLDSEPKLAPAIDVDFELEDEDELDVIALKSQLETVLRLDPETRAKLLLDRPLSPNTEANLNKLEYYMSPDELGEMSPDDAAEYLLSKLDIRRTLEIYSKLGISIKDYSLTDLPILLKKTTIESDEIPLMLNALPDNAPYPEAEEKLLVRAVEQIAFDAVAARRVNKNAEAVADALVLAANTVSMKPPEERTSAFQKKVLLESIKMKLREKRGIMEDIPIDESDPPLFDEENKEECVKQPTPALELAPAKKSIVLDEEQKKKEDDKTKVRLLEETRVTIQALLECVDVTRIEQYLDTVYQDNVWDVFLCYIDLKVCNRALEVDPGDITKAGRPTAKEYHDVIVTEVKKYTEQRKKRKPRAIIPEVGLCVKMQLYVLLYTHYIEGIYCM